MSINNKDIKCNFLGCTDDTDPEQYNFSENYCKFHKNGGIIGNGESYQQYQIIEEDFINFIKFVPLVPEHFTVHSPILRDIIIRTCVQIEIFFKEWSRQYCSLSKPEFPLMVKFNYKGKGEKNWTFGDYFIFKEEFNDFHPVYVLPLEIEIEPFKTWISENNPPVWWIVYNEIKHSGSRTNKKHTLIVALEALSALFLMHYTNDYSRNYLSQFISNTISLKSYATLSIFTEGFTTPIDTKNYLFKIVHTDRKSEHMLPDEIEFRKRYL